MVRRYLVVADETLGGKPLLDEVRALHEAGPSRFLVLVPAHVPREGLTWTESEARGLAEDRLERILNHLYELGVEGAGRVAGADPFLAIEDTLREEKFDEVILSAASKRSGWMKPNLPRKVWEAFGLPVTYLQGEREEAARQTALMLTALFAALPKRHLRALAKLAMVHGYRPGTTIVDEGSTESYLYVILDGRVRVTMGGRTVEHLSVGEVFGEISLLAPGSPMATVIAEAPTRCLTLSGTDLRAAMARDAQLTANVLEAAGDRMRELNRSVRDAMSGLVLEGELLEQLAEAAHVQYCADELAKGSSWGEDNDEYLLRHDVLAPYAGRRRDPALSAAPNLVAYENLSESVKEQNRDLVRDIPKKLAAAGYVMRQLGTGESPSHLAEPEIELLAEREHDRWVRLKLAQGWGFASTRDEEGRRHPGLVPWQELSTEQCQRRYGIEGASRIGPGPLPEEEKQKDRALVRKIGSILARIGYTAAKVDRTVE